MVRKSPYIVATCFSSIRHSIEREPGEFFAERICLPSGPIGPISVTMLGYAFTASSAEFLAPVTPCGSAFLRYSCALLCPTPSEVSVIDILPLQNSLSQSIFSKAEKHYHLQASIDSECPCIQLS